LELTLGGITSGLTSDVPWEVLRGVLLPWRSLGMGGVTRGVTLEVPWKLLRKVLPGRSLGRCDEGCYLGGPMGSITRGVTFRSLGRCYLGGPLGGVTRTTVAATRPTTTRMTKMEMKMPARGAASFVLYSPAF
jgi:hypothetical protein